MAYLAVAFPTAEGEDTSLTKFQYTRAWAAADAEDEER